MVAVVNCTSVTVAVHIGFGHEPGGAVGAVVVTSNWYWPFLGVGTGPVVPVTVVVKVWPGATFPPGLVHSTIAVPGAETLIVNVVSPRPATLPVHCTCVPMSVQVGVPTKCPACASAAPAKVVTSVSAATTATTRPRTERLVRMFPPPYLVVLAGWAAVTGPLGEPLLSVAGRASRHVEKRPVKLLRTGTRAVAVSVTNPEWAETNRLKPSARCKIFCRINHYCE